MIVDTNNIRIDEGGEWVRPVPGDIIDYSATYKYVDEDGTSTEEMDFYDLVVYLKSIGEMY